jgi:hypothetical protein
VAGRPWWVYVGQRLSAHDDGVFASGKEYERRGGWGWPQLVETWLGTIGMISE